MTQFQDLLQGKRLVTVEIIYHLPDFPELLQSFIWQDYDLPPHFPKLQDFLHFWDFSIEGRLHSVRIGYAGALKTPVIRTADFLATIH